MNIFKRVAKTIGKAAKSVGKAAPGLIVQGLNLGSNGVLGMVAEAVGLSSADPGTIEKHLGKMDPKELVELLTEKEKTKAAELKAIIEDRKDARALNQTYAQSGDIFLRWFLPCYSFITIGVLVWMFWVSSGLEEGKTMGQAALMILGAFLPAFGQQIDFWFGSGKRDQDHRQQLDLINH